MISPSVQWLYQPAARVPLSVLSELTLESALSPSLTRDASHWLLLHPLPREVFSPLFRYLESIPFSGCYQRVERQGLPGLLLQGQESLVMGVADWLAQTEEGLLSFAEECKQSWLRFHSELPAWTFREARFDFANLAKPLVMGIVNVTPDSFSDGGLFSSTQAAIDHGVRLVEEGADLLDIGGESTRPGATMVDAEAEKRRVLPVIEGLAKRVSVPLSVDTYKAAVARGAVQAGAEIVNDISCLRFDPDLAEAVAETGAYFLLMHSRHTPAEMQRSPSYQNLWQELVSELQIGVQKAIQAGVSRNRIGIDPGLGFGKRLQDNYRILREFSVLREFGAPILVGASRKSFLGTVLEERDPTRRLEGSLAAVAAALAGDAQFVRVHDVAETTRFLKVAEAIRRPPIE